ncbi:hypothetical protein ARMGADRAFT_1092316 [Armillaria gallica]|uniref:Uncharacterized protein n=1 Tax=Armillaria gallica TaxID=47427 RepID=A0A2H3CES5_ARMGA|nr:hypothetical protein ARMGADRAFT_1092316 [Armillaria gallica]
MAEPTNPAELAVVAAQDKYNAAAAVLNDLLDNFPNLTWDSSRIDTWITDAVSYWSTCEDNWSEAGVVSKEWYKLEYSLLVRVPDLSMDKVKFSHREFNELVERALDYNLDVVPLPVRRAPAKRSKTTASPSQSCQGVATTGSRMVTPTPSKTTTPVPPSTEARVIESSTAKHVPPPQNVGSSVPRIDFLAASPKAPVPVTPNSGTSKSRVTQPPANKTTGAQQQTTQRTVKPMPITAATPNVTFPPDPTLPLHQKPGMSFRFGPPVHTTGSETSLKSSSSSATWPLVNPGPNPADEGSVAPFPHVYGPLFFPGTDDKEEQVQGDLVEDSRIEDEIAVTALQVLLLPTWLDAFDMSPRFRQLLLHLKVKTFDAPSKSDAKKKKKDSKSKDKAPEVAVPHKRMRDDDDGSQAVDKPAVKKLKSKDIKTADDKVVHATPAVRKRGPDPTRPPAVTLGVGGGGFSEKVPSTAKAIKDGLKSIGVLEVEEDFGAFVKVDGHYWNKEVTPFYTEPCDHCKRLSTQCRKFLTNTVICMRCHYSKLPCKVNSVPALNPINHYRPKSYQTLNAFEGALDTLAQHADSIEDIIINYMASINALTQLNGLRVQARRLRECANFDDNAEDGGEGDEDEAPDDVAEGVPGPSKKKKGKSG